MRIHKHITREEAAAILDHYGWSALQLSEAAGKSDAWGRHSVFQSRRNAPMEWTEKRRGEVFEALARMEREGWPQSPSQGKRIGWAKVRARAAAREAARAAAREAAL